jgi:hypothetical protein
MVPIEILEKHYRKFIGNISDRVWHSTDSKPVHIDVYEIPPNPKRDFWTLITLGMCYQIQTLPRDIDIPGRTEIFMYTKEVKPWMIRVLKEAAEIPFDTHSYYDRYHTIDFKRPITHPKSNLTGAILLPPFFEEPGFAALKIRKAPISFLWFFPITNPEFAFAKKAGGRALNNLFSEKGISPVVHEERSSVV